jgi:hypothetical protein
MWEGFEIPLSTAFGINSSGLICCLVDRKPSVSGFDALQDVKPAHRRFTDHRRNTDYLHETISKLEAEDKRGGLRNS